MPNVRPATVVEVLQEGYRYRVAYGGAWYEMFTQPGGTNPQVGDLVFPRIVHGAAELFLPATPSAEMIYYGVPTQADGSGNTQAQLWSYNGTTHTQLYETVFTDGDGRNVTITCVFYLPATALVYFAAHIQWWDAVAIYEEVHLFSYNPSNSAVSDLGLSASVESVTDAYDDIWCPPLAEAAYFGDKAYLAQVAGDGIAFANRVYRFDPVGLTLTRVYTHPTVGSGGERPSLAVYGSELLFCSEVANTVYNSADGGSWALLETLGANVVPGNMMTDRLTGDVLLLYRDSSLLDVYTLTYAGAGFGGQATVSTDPNFYAGALGSQFNGLIRTWLWAVSQAQPAIAYRANGTWVEESLTPSYYRGICQIAVSIANEACYIGVDVAPNKLGFRRRVAGVWTVNKDFGYAYTSSGYGGGNYAMLGACRGRTAILPHEQ